MASWVTHLMIADKVMAEMPALDRHGFCVGNIAPDCNVENEDWTVFTPPREVTHWMSGERKKASDCDSFCKEYIHACGDKIKSREQYGFLLGYYAHLITDAAFQKFIRDEDRVRAAWKRIKADPCLRERAKGYPEDWDSVKKLLSVDRRMAEIYTIEAEYLKHNPDSGYLTEIMPLKEFPDYIDYLPTGCIARKVGVMGHMPEAGGAEVSFIAISREEYRLFIENTVKLVLDKFEEMELFVAH